MFGFRNEIRGCTRGGTALVRRRCRVGIAIAPPFLRFDRKPHDSATGLLVARCGIIITATRHATSLQTPESPPGTRAALLGRALAGGRAGTRYARHRPYQERDGKSRRLVEMGFSAARPTVNSLSQCGTPRRYGLREMGLRD